MTAPFDDTDESEFENFDESETESRPVAMAWQSDKLDEMLDYAQQCLIESDVSIYQSNGRLVYTLRLDDKESEDGIVRKKGSLTVKEVPLLLLHEWIVKHAPFRRRRLHPVTKKMKWAKHTPTRQIAAHILQRPGYWNFPVLKGVIEAPTLRADGTVLSVPGYDTASGLLLDTNGVKFPPIKDKPSKADARAALARLKEPFEQFPFVPDDDKAADPSMAPSASRSAFLAIILTGVIRSNLPTAPLFGISAASPGTGKTLLMDSASYLILGQAPTTLTLTGNESEDEKRLFSALLAKDRVVSIDNVTAPIGGAAINSILTRDKWSSRFLGVSENKPVDTNALFAANGNNLQYAGDTRRRAVTVRMVANCANPRTRAGFKHDLKKFLPRHRPALIVDALTVLRAFYVEGCPQQSPEPFGSFEEWSRVVRGALIWLGESDPCLTTAESESDNIEAETLHALLDAMRARFGNRFVKARDIMEAASGDTPDDDPFAARNRRLERAIEAARCMSAVELGNYLNENRDKVVGMLQLQRPRTKSHANVWTYRAAEIETEFG